jgi:hypothetical protein
MLMPPDVSEEIPDECFNLIPSHSRPHDDVSLQVWCWSGQPWTSFLNFTRCG